MNRLYKNIDTDDMAISLHDCYSTNISVEKDRITFYFANGFWITPQHKMSNITDTVRTDFSKAEFRFDKEYSDELSVYVFRKNTFNKIIREEWDIRKLSEFVNTRNFGLEFLYQYKNSFAQIIDCCLHFDKKPYYYECQIKIPASKTHYYWNNLCADKTW